MDIPKLFSLVTPLMLVALMGIIMIGYGFVDMKQDNNVLQFFFGIPLAAGAAGFHFLVRKMVRHNTLHVWIAESIIVALMAYGFLHS